MWAVFAAHVMYRDGSAFERARSGLWELEKDVVDGIYIIYTVEIQ